MDVDGWMWMDVCGWMDVCMDGCMDVECMHDGWAL